MYVNGIPNTELLPEQIVTYELGVHDESTFFHQADVVVYYNHLPQNLMYTARGRETEREREVSEEERQEGEREREREEV